MRFYEHAQSSGFHKKRASFRCPRHEDILGVLGSIKRGQVFALLAMKIFWRSMGTEVGRVATGYGLDGPGIEW